MTVIKLSYTQIQPNVQFTNTQDLLQKYKMQRVQKLTREKYTSHFIASPLAAIVITIKFNYLKKQTKPPSPITKIVVEGTPLKHFACHPIVHSTI